MIDTEIKIQTRYWPLHSITLTVTVWAALALTYLNCYCDLRKLTPPFRLWMKIPPGTVVYGNGGWYTSVSYGWPLAINLKMNSCAAWIDGGCALLLLLGVACICEWWLRSKRHQLKVALFAVLTALALVSALANLRIESLPLDYWGPRVVKPPTAAGHGLILDNGSIFENVPDWRKAGMTAARDGMIFSLFLLATMMLGERSKRAGAQRLRWGRLQIHLSGALAIMLVAAALVGLDVKLYPNQDGAFLKAILLECLLLALLVVFARHRLVGKK